MSSSKRNLFDRILSWPLLVAVLGLAAVGSLGTRGGFLRSRDLIVNDEGQRTTVHLGRLSDVRVLNLRSSQTTKIELSSHRFVLLVLLSAADCTSCFGELPGWKAMARRYPENLFSEVFVFVRSTPNEVAGFAETGIFAPTARMYVDSNMEVERHVGLPGKTPVTVLMDGSTQHAIVAEGADSNSSAQQKFMSLVEEKIRGEMKQKLASAQVNQ